MSQDGYLQPQCWCGAEESVEFSSTYRQCSACGTLFLSNALPKEHFEVTDDEGGFYGEEYWTKHVVESYGQPDIAARTRTDLPDRNLHWLRALLRYALPEEKVLEVACAHGSFVALLRQAGFDATGLDVSPAILEFAHRVFEIPTIRGPVEDASIPPASFRAIAAMDVLEHFTRPLDSMRRLGELLTEDGFFLIQTPCLRELGDSLEELQARNDRFLVHLKEDEHIYLFNQSSIRNFFERLGFSFVEFLEPKFDYDMFVVAARRPPTSTSPEEVANALSANVSRRVVLALLDLEDCRRQVYAKWQEAESDRAARLEIIAEFDRKLHAAGVELAASERDRAARLAVIEDLGGKLSQAESARAEAEGRAASLQSAFDASEQDRAARLTVIEDLSRQLAASERDRAARLTVIEDVSRQLAASERDRAARLAVIEEIAAKLGGSESERAAQAAELERLQRRLASATAKLDAIQRRLDTTLIGRALTASGWIQGPLNPAVAED